MVETGYYKDRPRSTSASQGCPVDHTFSPFEENYLKDPYTELKKRRNGTPVFSLEKLGYLVLTRLEDVLEVFRNPKIFSSENVQYPVAPICDAAKSVLAAADYYPCQYCLTERHRTTLEFENTRMPAFRDGG